MSKNTTPRRTILQMNISFGGPSAAQKVLFAKNLSVMLRGGMTLVDALATVEASLSGTFKDVIAAVRKKVESGVSFSQSAAAYPKVFPEVFVNVVQAGESAGTLSDNLEQIAAQLKKDKDLMVKVRGAAIYPIIVLAATFFLGLAVAFFVLPQIVPLFKGLGVELPFTTRALIAFSELVEAHGLVLLGVVVGSLMVLVWLLKRRFMRPVTHGLLLYTPVVRSITRHTNIARFTGTLGASLKGGIGIDEALAIVHRSVSNYYYQKALSHALAQVRAGGKLSDALGKNTSLFPPMLVRMIGVGERSGKLEETLSYLSDFYEAEVDTSLKTFTTVLEPLLLLGIGTVVGFFALSIIAPIYDITGNVQR